MVASKYLWRSVFVFELLEALSAGARHRCLFFAKKIIPPEKKFLSSNSRQLEIKTSSNEKTR
jgi:hypothetical protein